MPTPLKTIDITPTWSALLPTLIELAARGRTKQARLTAIEELRRMAQVADLHVAQHKSAGKGTFHLNPDQGARL